MLGGLRCEAVESNRRVANPLPATRINRGGRSAQSGGQLQLHLSRSESMGGIFTEVGAHELVHEPRLLMGSQDQARLETPSGIGEWLHDHVLLGASVERCRFRQDRNAYACATR